MKILRSLLFIPADKQKILDKIESIPADAFIMDLEDSVSSQSKEIARKNISLKLSELAGTDKVIIVRVNELDFIDIAEDIRQTVAENLYGYMIPKFEDADRLKEFLSYLEDKEEELKIQNKLKIILMVESSRGFIELRKLNLLRDNTLRTRITGLALGGEDYLASLAISREITKDMIDYARKEIILFARGHSILAIDTIYPDFKNTQGLAEEIKKIVSMGFTSKLAIHPAQVEFINSGFYPQKSDIEKMKLILSHRKDIEIKGAISINGVMYDPPHLRWAQKLKKYQERLDNLKK